MSARLLKMVLREQEEASISLQNHDLIEDADSESPRDSAPARNPFDLLEDEDDSDGDREHISSDQDKSNPAAEASDSDIVGKHSSSVKADVDTVSKPNGKSKKKKKKKNKKKIKENLIPSIENEISSTQMIDTSTLESSSSTHQQITSRLAKSKFSKVNNNDMMKKQSRFSILQVDPKFLSAENELRRIFGSKVVNSFDKNHSSANSRPMHGVRRGSHILKRTILVSPSEHWPRWDGSLSMELFETKNGVHYFRYTHSPSYAQAQRSFEAAKAIHDLNGIASILLYHPYHIDSLITLADYFKFTGDHQMSSDATAKCLYAMECAWHPQFTTPFQNCQLKYTHEANKPFFISLFNHMKNMDRRGCHRSALEICKLMLSLDSDDPMGSKFCIDYYALRAGEYSWLEKFAEEYTCDYSMWIFPNFSFSLGVCRFYLEKDEETGSGKATSVELMKQALMLHPSVVKKLVAKVPLKDRMWKNVVEDRFFRSEETGNPSLDHLIGLYVERSYLMWRLPDLQKLLLDSARMVIETLKEGESDAKDWACVRNEAFSSEKNEYSHLLVSDFSDTVSTMPPDNLQNFIGDPRGGIVDDQQPHNIPEDRVVLDVTSRNALAVLFESLLPWNNYGTGEDFHQDPPDQANGD